MTVNKQFLEEFMGKVDMRMFTPSLYRFFDDFLSIERVRPYQNQYVISTFIPPFPGKAFDRFMSTFFGSMGPAGVQAVDLAVTNACVFNCRHCYNAGRCISDPTTGQLKKTVRRLRELGAFVINFTGGEPCLRSDLADICSELGDDTAAIVSTTGYGFTDELARNLRQQGVYAVSISLDSSDEAQHDRIRGARGAFQIAKKGIETALKHGFYTYTCVVPTKQTLQKDNFAHLFELNRSLGVQEIQILEPAPAGKLLNSSNLLDVEDFVTIQRYMAEYNALEDGPAISSFAHLESPEFFGCGAGFSHIYIDGTGEVSPCNMMPVTYGNAYNNDLEQVIRRMQTSLESPCRTCRAYAQRDYFQTHSRCGQLIDVSTDQNQPAFHDGLPRFYEILTQAEEETTGEDEIIAGYTRASKTYDDYWLSVAAGPIDDLFDNIRIPSGATAIDCGCGTGYGTAKLVEGVGPRGHVIGIDLTEGMVARARKRLKCLGVNSAEFRLGDVFTQLEKIEPATIDVASATWLIGYVSCDALFSALSRVIKPGGTIGFVAHLDRSPELPFDVFEQLVRENPGVMEKKVQLDFPRDDQEVCRSLDNSGFDVAWLHRGTFEVTCRNGIQVFDHVMNSGAGSTFYHAVRESARRHLTESFIRKIDERMNGADSITVDHQ